jgi:hypothetical protein
VMGGGGGVGQKGSVMIMDASVYYAMAGVSEKEGEGRLSGVEGTVSVTHSVSLSAGNADNSMIEYAPKPVTPKWGMFR